MVKQSSIVIMLVIGVTLTSCHVPPKVTVEDGSSPPRFVFGRGTLTGMLLVYHLQGDAHGVFLDQLDRKSPDMMWMVEGPHEWKASMTYGTVPSGMRETVKVKPLIEGETYLVFVEALASDTFIDQDGKAKRLKRATSTSRTPNIAMQPSAGSAVLMETFRSAPAPADRKR